MARPSKRTAETQEAICDALRKGYTKKAAAAAGGIAYSSMREWELEFPEFSEAIEKAEGVAQAALLDTIVRASVTGKPGSWQAAAWVLERRWPKDYSRREGVELSGPDGGPIDTRDLSKVPDHERQALADAIRDHLAGRRGRAVRTGSEPGAESGD